MFTLPQEGDTLSLTHVVMAGGAAAHLPRATSRVPPPLVTTPALTMTPSPSQGRFVVIVRAGADEEVVRGPLWSPWWGTHLLALLAISVRERGRAIGRFNKIMQPGTRGRSIGS